MSTTIADRTGAPLFWGSFCAPDAPAGSQFLGVLILPATDLVDFARSAHMLKRNPGGEIAGGAIPDELRHIVQPGEIGRLLTKAEAETIGARMTAVEIGPDGLG